MSRPDSQFDPALARRGNISEPSPPRRGWDFNTINDAVRFFKSSTNDLQDHQVKQLVSLLKGSDEAAQRVLEMAREMKDQHIEKMEEVVKAWKEDKCEGALEKGRKREAAFMKDIGKLRSDVKGYKKELFGLRLALKSLYVDNEKLEEEAKRGKERFEELLQAKDHQILALQRETEAMRQEITGLKREGEDAKRKGEDTKREGEDTKREIAELREKVERTGRERANLIEQVQHKEQEKQELTSAVTKRERAVNNAERETERAERELVSEKSRTAELTTETSALRRKNFKWKTAAKQLVARLKLEQQSAWSKVPITGVLVKRVSEWYYPSGREEDDGGLRAFLEEEGLAI